MSATATMKAVHYEKPFEVSVREVRVPKIEHPDDAIIRVTTAGEYRQSKRNVLAARADLATQQSAAPTYTCTRAAPPPKPVSSSATKTWAS